MHENGCYEIRLAGEEDLPEVLRVYAAARRFMADHGNPTQWADGYPERSLLEADIQSRRLYVLLKQRRICAAFVLALGEEPTYGQIEEGAWYSQAAYGTIHRLASDGSGKGIFSRCIGFAREQCSHLRIDTHRDNAPMRHLIEKAGFAYCGIIRVRDGSPRLAYEWIASE